jgi:hypothetical protein
MKANNQQHRATFSFIFFCLDTKEAKNQGLDFSPTRYASTANRINVALRLTEFCFNADFAERVPRLRSLCRFTVIASDSEAIYTVESYKVYKVESKK